MKTRARARCVSAGSQRRPLRWVASALFFTPLFFTPLTWAEESSPISLGLQAGQGIPFSPSGFTELHHNPVILGARLGYQVSDQWSVGAKISSYGIGSSTSPSQDLRLTSTAIWAQREYPWTRLWTPYLIGDFGFSRNKADNFSSTESKTGWTLGLSMGLRLSISDMQDVSFEVGVRQFSHATQRNKDLRLFDGALVLRFFLPGSWVPMKPTVEISDADLEIPLVSEDSEEEELDPMLLAQEEIHIFKKEIDTKKIPPIAFEPGSAIPQTTSFVSLEMLGTILRRYPDVHVQIYGFADEGCPPENRETLALARAQVVGTYLVRNFYISEARFLFSGQKPPSPSEPGKPAAPVLRQIDIEAIPNR